MTTRRHHRLLDEKLTIVLPGAFGVQDSETCRSGAKFTAGPPQVNESLPWDPCDLCGKALGSGSCLAHTAFLFGCNPTVFIYCHFASERVTNQMSALD